MKTSAKTLKTITFIILFCFVILLAGAATASALSNWNTTSPEDTSEGKSLVYERFESWGDRLYVNELSLFEKDILQLFFTIPTLDDPSFNPRDIFEPIFIMSDEGALPYAHIYVNVLNPDGEALISYDIDMSTNLYRSGVFAYDDEREDPAPEVTFGLDETFTVADGAFTVRRAEILSHNGEDYLKLYFDYTNLTDAETSAHLHISFWAEQAGVPLPPFMGLDDDFETTYKPIEIGMTMPNCTVAFFLDNYEDPVRVHWQGNSEEQYQITEFPLP